MFWDHVYQGRTLVFGHRGASAYAPMNTLPAFELAAIQGAHGIELDVHLSRDGYPIVLHDYTVDHTTDGHGYAKDLNLVELKKLDAGILLGGEFTNTQIPTLDEVFDLVGQKLHINVEIKSETAETDGVEQVVAQSIVKYRMQERVLISSFNPMALKRFRDIMPSVPIGLLVPPDEPALAEVGAALPYEAVHPYHEMIDQPYMAMARANGWRVNAWTVNDPVRARELRDLGVDAVITDLPDVILRALYD